MLSLYLSKSASNVLHPPGNTLTLQPTWDDKRDEDERRSSTETNFSDPEKHEPHSENIIVEGEMKKEMEKEGDKKKRRRDEASEA